MRCATGEAWNSIMFESARSYSILYQCEEDESYEAIVARGEDPSDHMAPKGCGPTTVAFAFFLLFQLLVGQIFLNLFIAIIIDAFFGQNDLANLPISPRSVEEYANVWSKFDPHATGYMDIQQLSNFLRELALNEDTKEMMLFADKIEKSEEFRARLIVSLDIPTYQNFKKVMFYDVLQQVVNHIVKLHHNREKIAENKAILKVLKALQQKAHDDTLQALNLQNVKSDYDIDFDDLISQMRSANSRIELVQMINERSKKLHKMYNHLVDNSE
jgi:Ca2+-binding EF-hand superfamily protein